MIYENYLQVQKNINDICNDNGIDNNVTLIPVSKTKPISELMKLYDNGIKIFGENYVQELVEKYNNMPKDIEWHMIGHLQRNKVKDIVSKVRMIHSVDSIRLAAQIQKECEKIDKVMDVLIEINCDEDTKFGFTFDEAIENIVEISKYKNLHICGLMTSAPYVSDPEENRAYFRKLKQLSVDISNKNIDNVSMNVLSMGMTNDYLVAVSEGATYVRVGTAIFGARNYS